MNNSKAASPSGLTVIGLASSAGGLEALSAVLSHFDALDGLAVIIAQHTSPEYESLLPALLTRASHLRVLPAESGLALTPGAVLVIPPGFDGVVGDGKVCLEKSERSTAPHPSANKLFVSLAEEYGPQAIAIVLSGTGSDGAIGARAVKAHGGFVIAQTPETAKYDGMPSATISSTAVDLILPPEDIGPSITGLRQSMVLGPIENPEILGGSSAIALFEKLESTYQIDFRQYKSKTVGRRFARRIVATGCENIAEYGEYVERNPDELNLLYLDLIISVTSFFRDPDLYNGIRPYLTSMLKNKSIGDEIRIWVPGCATGEEAYSIAILVNQLLGDSAQSYRIQVFATDIDQTALAIARKGFYEAPSLKDIDLETRDRFFYPAGSGYQVTTAIQEQILFAQHNLTVDPPFLHLDLISCRNVMIYFTTELQARVLETFHYGLERKGLLFLGKSESVAGSSCFEDVSNKLRLFRKIPGARTGAVRSYAQRRAQIPSTKHNQPKVVAPATLEEQVRSAIGEHILSKGFVVDATLEVQYVYGDLTPIAQLTRGKPGYNVQNLIAARFQPEIQSLVHRLRRSGGAARSAPVLEGDSLICFEGVTIAHPDRTDAELFFIQYQKQSVDASSFPDSGSDSDSNTIMHLQNELLINREHLQTAMEELQTSNEELQSANEELQSSNEELQSTNEELETANEELQSSNEELVTVNEEVQAKSEQLNVLNHDLLNLQNSLPHPLILVDKEFHITHHNTACQELFKYEAQLQGLRISELSTSYKLPNLIALITEAISGTSDGDSQSQISGDKQYWLTVTPYKEKDGKINGAVLIFWNNTELLALHKRLQESMARSSLQGRALEAAQQGVTIADASIASLPLIYVNSAFTRMTGYAKEEVFGRNCRFLQGPSTSGEVRKTISKAISNQQPFHGQLINYRKDGSEFHNLLELSPIFDEGKVTHYVGIQTDITELVNSEKERAFSHAVFENTQETIVILGEDEQIKYANPAASRLFQKTGKALTGKPLDHMVTLKTSKTHRTFDSVWRTVKKQNRWQGQLTFTLESQRVTLLVSINRVRSPDNIEPHYVMLASDITELKKKERDLKRLATIDALTGLPNRSLFQDRLKEAVARACRSKQRFALMFLDVDNFKRINDTMGHKVGDNILKHLAKTVQDLTRENDTFARISGDEFVLILDSLTQPSDSHQFAQRIIHAFSKPYLNEEQEILLSVSIGVAIFPEDGESADILMRNADLAMYRAKQRGKAQVSFVDPERSGVLWEQMKIEAALRKGLIEGENIGLNLNFQPVYDAQDTSFLRGFEALIRWNHPELGKLMPDQFLPLARSAGFSMQLDIWVFRQFLVHYSEWYRQTPSVSQLRFAINIDPSNVSLLSRSQISAFLSDLDDSINRPKLCLEITENALIDIDDNLRNELESLKQMDVMVSIDDFGSGFSNFVYLTDLELIRQIKIDQSLMAEIDSSQTKLRRLRAIIHMLKDIGYQVVVEGLENETQLELLSGAGHDSLQGFYLSRPLNPDQAEILITTLANQFPKNGTPDLLPSA